MVDDLLINTHTISPLNTRILPKGDEIFHFPLLGEFQSILSLVITGVIGKDMIEDDPMVLLSRDKVPSSSGFLCSENDARGINSLPLEMLAQINMKISSAPLTGLLVGTDLSSLEECMTNPPEEKDKWPTLTGKFVDKDGSNHPSEMPFLSISGNGKSNDTKYLESKNIGFRPLCGVHTTTGFMLEGLLENPLYDENLDVEVIKHIDPRALRSPSPLLQDQGFIETSGMEVSPFKGKEKAFIEGPSFPFLKEIKAEHWSSSNHKWEEIFKGEKFILSLGLIKEEEGVPVIAPDRFGKDGGQENPPNKGDPSLDDILSRTASKLYFSSGERNHIPWLKESEKPIFEEKAILNQVTDGLKFLLKRVDERMQIKLHPPSLGDLRMEITTKGNLVHTTIVVENDMVKAILENNSLQLRLALEEQGLKMDQFLVLVNGDNCGGGRFSNFFYKEGSDDPTSGPGFESAIDRNNGSQEKDRVLFGSLRRDCLIYIIV